MHKRLFYGQEQPFIQEAFSIRKCVFSDEQGFDPSIDIDEYDQRATHVIIYDETQPIATGRLIIKDQNQVKIGRVAVLAQYRGQGIGVKVMQALIDVAIEKNIPHICLSAQIHAQYFYEKLGFIAIGEVYLEEGAEHIAMILNREN